MAKKKNKKKKARLSQSQLDQRAAAKMVDQELSAPIAEINRQKAEAAANAKQRQDFINSMTQTAAGMAGEYAPAVQGAFQTAAQDQTAFGKGYSNAFKSAQNEAAAKTNTILQQSGAPQAQMAAGDTGAADALYGIAGAQPGSTLATEGAAFTSAAAKLPTTTALAGQQYGLAASNQDAATMKDILSQLTQVKLKRPGLINDVISQIQSNRSKSQQQAFENKVLLGNQGISQQNADTSTFRAQTDAAYKQSSLRIQMQKVAKADRPKINSALSKMFGYLVDSYGQPVLSKNGKAVGIPQSPNSLSSADMKTLANSVRSQFFGVKDAKTGAWTVPKMDYGKAYRDLIAAYPDNDNEVRRVLNLYYTEPGKRGRPYFSTDLKRMSLSKLRNLAATKFRISTSTPPGGAGGPTNSKSKLINAILEAQGLL
jgi:hypothetical protein